MTRRANQPPTRQGAADDARPEEVRASNARNGNAPHIAAVVINSVSHDARVLKEADGLAAAGYRVTIYGIQDSRCNEPVSVRPSGVVVRRGEWRSQAYRLRAAWLTTVLVLIVGAGLGLVVAIFFGHGSHPIISALTVGSVAISLVWIAERFRRNIASARKAAASIAGATRASVGAPPIPAAMAPAVTEVKPLSNVAAAATKPTPTPTPKASAPSGRLARMRSQFRTWYANKLRSRALVELILHDPPDAIHAHDLQALPVGWAIKSRTGCPLVFDSHELHDDLSQIGTWIKRRSQRAHRFYSTRVDGLITVNDSIAATIRERYPSFPEAVIIRNATRFDGDVASDDGRLHRAAGLPRSTRILLYQGGFARHRGLDVLVRSAAILPEGWVLVMMGWGTFEPKLREVAAEVDPKGERVRFLPGAPQVELAQWTSGASLGVIPYENVCLNHWFCTPNKIWEYPVAGVPILASPFPELRKAVEGNGTGVLLADPVTPENIADTLASVSDERLAEMRANCRRFLERDNWSIYERRLIELYRRLLGSAARASTNAATGFTAPPESTGVAGQSSSSPAGKVAESAA